MKDFLDARIQLFKILKYSFWDMKKKLKEFGVDIDKKSLLKRIKKLK